MIKKIVFTLFVHQNTKLDLITNLNFGHIQFISGLLRAHILEYNVHKIAGAKNKVHAESIIQVN